jgi:hypothetical protein
MRRAWPEVLILLRGDGHCSTPEVQQWCASQEPVVCYILGQSGNAVLTRQASGLVDQARSLYRYKHERARRKQEQEHRKQQKPKAKKEISNAQERYQARSEA